jgi:hypothetical protein
MSTGGIFLLLAFLGGVGAVIVWPLLFHQGKSKDKEAPVSVLTQLQAEHEAVLLAVRDLDFDHQTGKLVQDDYLVQREMLMQRGVEILKQIDAVESDLIEQAVKAKRKPR